MWLGVLFYHSNGVPFGEDTLRDGKEIFGKERRQMLTKGATFSLESKGRPPEKGKRRTDYEGKEKKEGSSIRRKNWHRSHFEKMASSKNEGNSEVLGRGGGGGPNPNRLKASCFMVSLAKLKKISGGGQSVGLSQAGEKKKLPCTRRAISRKVGGEGKKAPTDQLGRGMGTYTSWRSMGTARPRAQAEKD